MLFTVTSQFVLDMINAITMLPFFWIAVQVKHEILSAAIIIFSVAGFVHHTAKAFKKATMATFLIDIISQLMMLYIVTTHSPYLKNNTTTQSIRVFLLAGIFVLLIVQVVGVKYSYESATLSAWFLMVFYLSLVSDAGSHFKIISWVCLFGCIIIASIGLLYKEYYYPAWFALHALAWFTGYYTFRDLKLLK